MNIPRWLLIVAIMVVVLGILACGIGVARVSSDKPAGSGQSPQRVIDIPALPVAPADVAMSGSCTKQIVAGETRFTGTSCTLTVTPSGFLPHELRLKLVAGSGTLTMTQTIRGEPRSSDPGAIPTSAPLHIRVAGSDPVATLIFCVAGCTVAVVTE